MVNNDTIYSDTFFLCLDLHCSEIMCNWESKNSFGKGDNFEEFSEQCHVKISVLINNITVLYFYI